MASIQVETSNADVKLTMKVRTFFLFSLKGGGVHLENYFSEFPRTNKHYALGLGLNPKTNVSSC